MYWSLKSKSEDHCSAVQPSCPRMTACFCCCSWFKKPKSPLSASHPTFEEVALELSLSQALSLQQTHRAFVHASCYIYLILPQVTVICILSTLVPPKVVTEQKKELLNCQPVRAWKALRNHHLWLSFYRCRKAKGLASGHPGSWRQSRGESPCSSVLALSTAPGCFPDTPLWLTQHLNSEDSAKHVTNTS